MNNSAAIHRVASQIANTVNHQDKITAPAFRHAMQAHIADLHRIAEIAACPDVIFETRQEALPPPVGAHGVMARLLRVVAGTEGRVL